MNRYTDEELDKMYQQEMQKKSKVYLKIIMGIVVVLFVSVIPGIGALLVVALVVILIKYRKNIFSGEWFRFTDVLHDLLIPYCTQDLFGEDAVYNKNQGISRSLVKSSHLVGKSWNEYYTGNLVQGTYMGVSFMQADVHLVDHTEYEDSDGNTSSKDVTVFQGPWAVIDFKKPFSTNLIVRERGEKLLDKWADGKSNIEMENVAFNKKFIVLTEDEHNAFYLLTPQMMEHIIETEKRFMGRIYFCFMDGKIHIAIDNGKSCFANIPMEKGAGEARKEIYGRLSLVPELMKQLDIE